VARLQTELKETENGSIRRKLKRSRLKCSKLEEHAAFIESSFARRLCATSFVASVILEGLERAQYKLCNARIEALHKQNRHSIQRAVRVSSAVERVRALSSRNELLQVEMSCPYYCLYFRLEC
jgi:hypothetical protein